jgi:serine/threonine protein kinase
MDDSSKTSWSDIDIAELTFGKCPVLVKTGHSHIYKYGHRFAAKVPSTETELEMMMYAGVISITPYGRVLKGEKQVGIVMELGEPLDVNILENDAKRNLVNAIISLVTDLHKKGLLHGDIKLANLLRAMDGSLRLCDFEGAQKEPCTEPPEAQTLNWISPARLRNLELPLCKPDDLYALGLTIWEVYAGRIPFSGLDERQVEAKIMANETVDMAEISDPDIREIVAEYLVAGSRLN